MSKPKFKKLKRRDRWLSLSWEACLLAAMIVLVWSYAAVAKPPATATLPAGAVQQNWQVTADTIWVLFTGCLVFFMNAGFCMLETGFCRHKNAVSILAQTFIVFALVTVAYWATGFGLMFGFGGDLSNAKATDNGFIGLHGFFLDERDNGVFRSLNWTDVPVYAKFFFQLVFADTAVTIFTGAVAERIKFIAFFIFSLLLGGLSYPITGHWIWGDGWLAKLGFYDFAGSTVVHSVGGWAGLVGASLLGPRIGRYALFRSRTNGDTTDRQAELVGFLWSRNRYIQRFLFG